MFDQNFLGCKPYPAIRATKIKSAPSSLWWPQWHICGMASVGTSWRGCWIHTDSHSIKGAFLLHNQWCSFSPVSGHLQKQVNVSRKKLKVSLPIPETEALVGWKGLASHPMIALVPFSLDMPLDGTSSICSDLLERRVYSLYSWGNFLYCRNTHYHHPKVTRLKDSKMLMHWTHLSLCCL